MARVVVTGGSGKLGRACLADLLEHGWDVVNIDRVPPSERVCDFVLLDLTDLGQTVEALSGVDGLYHGVDAVVHLAAIPAPGITTNGATFANNIVCTYNVFQAARVAGITNIAWASSETVLGLPFDTPPPYLPVDEECEPRPEYTYALAKTLEEHIATHFCRWEPELKMIGLRFSNVIDPAEYADFPAFDEDSNRRKWNLWSYVDARDAAQAVRKALDYPGCGMDVFIIANADSVMTRSNDELMAEHFPGVPMRKEIGGNETLLSIGKARRILGYEPKYSWRTEVAAARRS
jgi:nucleoside-diphosphate-sugar epimerase